MLRKPNLCRGCRYLNVAFQTNSCSQLYVYNIVSWSKNLLVLFSLGVSAQCDEMFNCTFSGCPRTNLTCYCSVQNNVTVLWWSSINISGAVDCITIGKNQMMPPNRPENVSAEVVDRTSNGFTSRLVWQSVSTEVNGSEIGCFHSSSICSRDQNLNFTLLVTGCQGNGIVIKH